MIISEEVYLAHYGTPRHSGRYPWGSGGDITQRSKTLLDNIQKLQAQGLSQVEIAQGFDMTTTQLRNEKTVAIAAVKQADINQAQKLFDKGVAKTEIGRIMGKPEATVRALLAPGAADKTNILFATTNMLREQLVSKDVIDVGKGVGPQRNISAEKLRAAVSVLENEGYKTHDIKIKQVGTKNQFTTFKVLAKPEITRADIYKDVSIIKQIDAFSDDGGRTYDGFQPPLQISSKRVAINYAEDGGTKADGVIYVRRGVSDVSLDKANYAQVRIGVDGTHYIKGLAIYKDNLPAGVDLVFNTNKSKSEGKLGVLKPIDDDPDNPFGAVVDQIFKRDPAGNPIRTSDGKPIVTSAMNIVNREGDWGGWTKDLSAQMLSKQSPKLIKSQLDTTYELKKKGLDDILALTNPTVRTKLLEGYSDALDSSAVHLEAASLPRQSWHVIVPVNTLKDTEVYAPNFRNGERVVLIRYPHGGKFEIPELQVNNGHKAAKDLIGSQAKDAIGINSNVAQRLSGADFDGDFVMVIPNDAGHVKTAPALAGLKDFDPKSSYPGYEGMPKMKPKTKQNEMGSISNLITDMSIVGASPGEYARAVRHSMVVIDAEKHGLNYKASAIENGIPALKEKYQGGKRYGSATLISRAGKTIEVPVHMPRRAKEGGPIEKTTGEKKFKVEPETYVNRAGQTIVKKRNTDWLAEEKDAFALSSGTAIESLYATHSNKLKALANEARKEMVNTPSAKRDPSAAVAYKQEVNSLNAKLNIALRNAPLERQAQLIANTTVSAKKAARPEMDNATIKKIESQDLIKARIRTGAAKQDIYITDNEWNAIQAGAISNSKLTQILDKSNLERVKQLATPKPVILMTSTKQQRAASMLASGYTQAQVADALGVSLSTLKASLNGGT